ncbi:MAG: hypothetical protein KDC35_18600 [Acidobacteria bacterium]|nr:hypothetical protein [Acidobacteriota bacterium]
MKKTIVALSCALGMTLFAGVPGTYVLDKVSLEKAMMDMMAQQMQAVPEEQRAASMEMAKTQMKATVDAMSMKCVFNSDGTAEFEANMGPQGAQTAKGTWKLDGETLSMTKTHENGEDVEDETMEATFKDGKIIIQPEGSPMAVVLVKE